MSQRFRVQHDDPVTGQVVTFGEEFTSIDEAVHFIADMLGHGTVAEMDHDPDLIGEIEGHLEKDGEHEGYHLFEVPVEEGRAVRLTTDEWQRVMHYMLLGACHPGLELKHVEETYGLIAKIGAGLPKV